MLTDRTTSPITKEVTNVNRNEKPAQMELRPLPEIVFTLRCPECAVRLWHSHQRFAGSIVYFHNPKASGHEPSGCQNDRTAYIVDGNGKVIRVNVDQE
jgi:hypothetical protein